MPQFPGHLLDGVRLGGLQRAVPQLLESHLLLMRSVGRVGQPVIPSAFEIVSTVLHQGLTLVWRHLFIMAAPIRGTLIGLACAQAVWLMHGGDGNRRSGQAFIQACIPAGHPGTHGSGQGGHV